MPVVHCKKHPHDVYIGRPSKWGNPFQVGVDGTRLECIEKYRDYLWEQIKNNQISLEELSALHNKTLGCWCSPKPCHGDELLKAAQWAHEKLYGSV